jgi:hypothetical protein
MERAVGVVLVALVVVLLAVQPGRSQMRPCPDPSDTTPSLSGPVNLRLQAGEPLRWRMVFGSGREPLDTPMTRYTIEVLQDGSAELPSDVVLPVSFDVVTRKHDQVTVPNHFLSSEARVRGDEVHIRACIDPGSLPPGEYFTSARITVPHLNHSSIPVEIALRARHSVGLWAMLVLSWVVGSLMLVARDQDLVSQRSQLAVLVVLGVIASVWVSQTALFVQADFGKSFQDYFQAFVVSLGAFVLGEGVGGTVGTLYRKVQSGGGAAR